MTTSADIQVQTDVPARMRDGVILRADVYRPAEPGAYPVLLTRTPYDKASPADADTARALALHGYIAVVQDVRGRFASEGTYRVLDDDSDDGCDAILRATGLEGASGVVGMFGGSYTGYTQFQAAARQPAPLRAIFPIMCSPSLYERWYEGGAVALGDMLGWQLGSALEAADRRHADAPELRRYGALGRELLEALLAGDQAAAARARSA
ncbi:MAG TPA: CocE/NonD family hydrolase, partial [Dehalococcoidia bacterium]|nr:CocE/NonD family hydrolase [Dehalococcoidia bacterium]